ncbi:cytochrome d ubiquinol oxidase subunit II [Oceanithermus sp.]|uniref:cytochrome d ubiquinol oxidase subunit II n=1 Tax=Oceanithermus sp. TaxID=2268145 RepID=UPI0025CDA75C|nr:cytochrome d ubiquinol oxidase subunit II [Oceanithermus sp.]
MDLHVVWFVLITVLFAGFFFLEGFDYGVGMWLPFLGRNDAERRAIINTIGPVWDGNEVWMITAGGAMFAAFPHWYATLFSGFYLALFLMLLALILRGVAFEYRSLREDPGWRTRWDWAIFFGSAAPAFLWGVAVANLVRGVPIDAHMQYTGTFWTLLNPYGLLGGLAAVAVFLVHGGQFLALKLEGDLAERARRAAHAAWWPAVVALVLFVIGLFGYRGYLDKGALALLVPFAAALAFVAVRFLDDRAAFWSGGVAIVLATVTVFVALFPNVMPSTLNPDWSLTIYNASASNYTLGVMTVVALVFTPLVLLYQGWTYWVFRGRVRVGEGGY